LHIASWRTRNHGISQVLRQGFQGEEIVDVPIAEAIAELKTVPLDSDLVRAARYMGISLD